MAHRSPNCPHITFQEAAEKGRKVYAKERQHPATKKVIAEDLGYSGINGRSLSVIGALRQYGVLEGSGDAMRVSDDAVAYYVRDDGSEKNDAIKRMVYKPALFAELNAQFGDSLPSDGNLRHILVTKGFSEETATEVIRVYKENAGIVGGKPAEYNEGAPLDDPRTLAPPAVSAPNPVGPPRIAVGAHAWTWTLSVPRQVNAQLHIAGDVTRADIARLRRQIEFLEESFEEEEA